MEALAMAFKNIDTYCVAPITSTPFANKSAKLDTYDFWAVGVNCCSGVASDFRCGEFNNPAAHSGLRLMDEKDRSYFRVAVQQAEAAYNLQATHPLFFYWAEDTHLEWQGYWDYGNKYYNVGVVAFIFLQIFTTRSMCASLSPACTP